MATFFEAVAGAARSSLCAIIAVNDDGARLFRRVIPGPASTSDYLNFFAPLRRQLCNDPDYDPPEPPYTGGQCDAIYQVTFEGVRGNGAVDTPFTRRVHGPLGGTRALASGGSAQLQVECRAILTGTTTCGPLTPGEFVFRNVGLGGSAYVDGNLNIVSTSICSGVDDCGDPPVDPPPPPGPVTRPTTVIYNTDEGDEITEEGDFIFAPFFSVGDLDIRVPFELNLGGVNFKGEVNIAPEFSLSIAPRFNFGGGGAGDDPDGLIDVDPEETEEPEEGEDDPVIIGVLVRSEIIGELRATAIATEDQPTIYAPRVGSVSFAIRVGETFAWTPDVDIKNLDCYIPCPAPQGAIDVGASAAAGFAVSYTPVRGRPLLPAE